MPQRVRAAAATATASASSAAGSVPACMLWLAQRWCLIVCRMFLFRGLKVGSLGDILTAAAASFIIAVLSCRRFDKTRYYREASAIVIGTQLCVAFARCFDPTELWGFEPEAQTGMIVAMTDKARGGDARGDDRPRPSVRSASIHRREPGGPFGCQTRAASRRNRTSRS